MDKKYYAVIFISLAWIGFRTGAYFSIDEKADVGAISGMVFASHHGYQRGVKIHLIDAGEDACLSAQEEKSYPASYSGSFKIYDVQKGTYRLKFTRHGFSTKEKTVFVSSPLGRGQGWVKKEGKKLSPITLLPKGNSHYFYHFVNFLNIIATAFLLTTGIGTYYLKKNDETAKAFLRFSLIISFWNLWGIVSYLLQPIGKQAIGGHLVYFALWAYSFIGVAYCHIFVLFPQPVFSKEKTKTFIRWLYVPALLCAPIEFIRVCFWYRTDYERFLSFPQEITDACVMAVTILYLILGNLLLLYRFNKALAPVQKFHLLLTVLTVFFPPALFFMVFGTMYLFQLDAFFDNDMLFFTSLAGIFVSVSLGYGLILKDYIQVSIEAQYHQRLAFIGLVDTKLMHDLRAPITYMKHLSQTLSSLLHKQPQDHEKIHSTSNLIHQNADRALSFISSFREQLMQEKPHLSLVNIVDIVGEAVSLIRLPTEKEVEINQRIDETLSYHLDKNKFLSMFASLTNGFALWLVNILRNSVDSFSGKFDTARKPKASVSAANIPAEENGRIDITGEVRDGYLRLAITDNGCGIKEEYIEKVFDSFYTTKSDSMGLGLFFVKQEVEKYGGSVSCKSKEGSGTTITITLPIK